MPSVVELQQMAFEALDELCSSLEPAEWEAPTDCPGWSVKDNLSHIVGTEALLLGRPAPEHDPGPKPWVHNPVGTNNEIQVDYRRAWAPEKVLEEFREVTGDRMTALRSMSEAELDAESWTPIGQGTVRDLVAIRVMDCWVHEQDMRRAVSKPGSLDGPVAEHAFARHSTALPFVVGKKVAPPDGSTVVFDVKGFGTVPVGIDGKRAARLDAVPGAPTVKLTMDLEIFNRLCTGRGDAAALAEQVTIEGDEALGRKVIAEMNFMI